MKDEKPKKTIMITTSNLRAKPEREKNVILQTHNLPEILPIQAQAEESQGEEAEILEEEELEEQEEENRDDEREPDEQEKSD
jgi:hypothetical protein